MNTSYVRSPSCVVTRSCATGALSDGRAGNARQADALAADLLTRKTSLWVHATSLGGVESTFERRRRWRTEAATIPEGLVRMSVGIEDVDDLWADLDQALNAV